MAKRKKKLNKVLAIICAISFFTVGFIGCAIGKSYIFGTESYVIPEAETATKSISAGSIDIDLIKEEDLSIHFIELGNKYTGDCTFIKVGETEILIDAGSRASSVKPISDYISQYIEGDLDYVIVTHAHQDHYAGFATNEGTDSLFDIFTTETIIKFSQSNQKETAKLYSNFNREVSETKTKNGTNVYDALQCYNNEAGAQRVYDLGNNVELQILYHEYYEKEAHSENDYSVSCMINQNDENYYLFTGDLEAEGEESLVNEYKSEYGTDLPKMKLYKAGHHGSKTSSSKTLLDVIQPEIVCVCCCAGSSEYTKTQANQFPTQAFIDRIAEHTPNVYVTTMCLDYNKGSFQSMNGNIVVAASVSEEVSVYCANNALVLKDTEWFKQNRKMPESWAS